MCHQNLCTGNSLTLYNTYDTLYNTLCCSMLQHVAACCSMLHCVARLKMIRPTCVILNTSPIEFLKNTHCNTLQIRTATRRDDQAYSRDSEFFTSGISQKAAREFIDTIHYLWCKTVVLFPLKISQKCAHYSFTI